MRMVKGPSLLSGIFWKIEFAKTGVAAVPAGE